MKLVVGLGNPGKKYAGTRHNVGFDVLAELSARCGGGKPKERFEAETVEIFIGTERVLLLAPQTYMNASGRSVRQAVDFFQLPLADVMVVSDDLNLPVGKLRIRGAGSAGGQKGLENIIQQLRTNEFARLRIGIDPPPANTNAADYVLGRFGKIDGEAVKTAIFRSADAIEAWVRHGVPATMNQFNSDPDVPPREPKKPRVPRAGVENDPKARKPQSEES